MSARVQGQDPLPRRLRVPTLAPAVVTTRGCRETNQDRVCALRTLVGSEPAVLLALADGVGGLPAGEQAAELALQVVSHYAHYVIPEAEPVARGIRDALAGLLQAAGRRIWLWARDQGLGGAAGSTLVCALVWDRHYLVAHAGNSRCYYVNPQGVKVLTRDHVEAVSPEREAGSILEGSHRTSVRHQLTNAVGWSTDLIVGLTPADDQPGALDDDCALLVCSDGLHTTVTESDIHAALRQTRGVEGACRRLVRLALDRGSTDNVSVAAVEIGHLRRHVRSAHSA